MILLGLNEHSEYRYSFQGQEKDDEIKGAGNSINYTYRMHDPRIGRFFAVDPLAARYSYYTPYSFSANQVIHTFELEGKEGNKDLMTVSDPLYWQMMERQGPEATAEFVAAHDRAFLVTTGIGVGAGLAIAFPALSSAIIADYLITKSVQNYYSIQGDETMVQVLDYIPITSNAPINGIDNYLDEAPVAGPNSNKTTTTTTSDNISTNNAENADNTNNSSTDLPGSQSTSNANSQTGITNKGGIQSSGKVVSTQINNGRVVVGGNPAQGNFDFVITNTGELKIGTGHSYLANGETVSAAGSLKFRDGQLVGVTNASGHYLPSPEEAGGFINMLQKTGIDVSNAHLLLYNADGTINTHVAPTKK